MGKRRKLDKNASGYELASVAILCGLSLPDCILLKIFRFLSFKELCSAARVCKTWNRIAKDDSLRRKIDVRDTSLTVNQAWKLLRHHGTSVLFDLRLRGFLARQKQGKPGGKSETTTQAFLLALARRCPHLHRLTLEEVYLPKSKVTSKDFPQHLQHLSLKASHFMPDSFLSSPFFPNLVCLDLSFCILLTSHDLDIIARCQALRVLNIEGNYRINSGGINHLQPILGQIQVLNIESTEVNNVGVSQILQQGQSLEELFLGHLKLDDSPILKVRRSSLLCLHTLCVIHTEVGETGLVHLVSQVPSLRLLYVNSEIELASIQEKIANTSPASRVEHFGKDGFHNRSIWGTSCGHPLNHKCSNN
ncbi:F-box/LRR-repeat protein 12-like [Limulus polyphemus]|uniref:F-box/LRR-repeat protein 12-like n=1 Tax=Limulus polyphemus TaxID=6850 RepID=A0ABM1BJM8_LIMPO|nr:F-box/LRR-repeat protein 12-like [Limulus polyphemus]